MSGSTQPTPAPKAKIAVIDDDRFIRYLLDLHLRNAGYQVFVAEDAVAGARLILECTPDVILCDVDMPFMDGYQFVSALRADPATRHIPVIFLTVNKNVGERAKRARLDFEPRLHLAPIERRKEMPALPTRHIVQAIFLVTG